MAKVLFFLQLMTAFVVLPLWPGLDPRYFLWGLGFLALVLTVPLAAAGAVFGPGAMVQALKDAWSSSALGPKSRESLQVWTLASRCVPLGGLLAGLAAVSGALQAIDPGRPAVSQILVLGFFCLVWGFLGLLVARILGEVVRKLGKAPLAPVVVLGDELATRFGLTPRETETAQAVVDGLTYKDTAVRLHVGPSTVKSHILSVYQKTGTGNKIELLRLVEAETYRIHQKVNGQTGAPPLP